MKKGKRPPSETKYSQAFKLKVVREYKLGYHTKDSLMNKY